MHERSDKKDDAVKPMSLCGVGNFRSFYNILRIIFIYSIDFAK